MLFSHVESTEDVIVRVSAQKEFKIKDLHLTLEKEVGKKITLQALYRAIKKLVADGVLVKKGILFTLNKEWAKKIVSYFDIKDGIELSEREDVTYSFKSLSALDSYWKHTITQLQKMLGNYPIFFYNNHVVWLHLRDRKESQKSYLNSFDKEKRYAGFVVGGTTLIDRDFKKNFSNDYLQIDLRQIDSIKQDSLTVHGDYVMIVKFNKKTTNFVDSLYRNSKSIQELENDLEKSLEGKLLVKLIIERNKKKADKIRKILGKNFYVPKEIKEEFGLIM